MNNITVKSYDNPDWNGVWDKDSVVAELREIGNEPAKGEDWLWLEYVLNNVFDFSDEIDQRVLHALYSGQVTMMNIVSKSGLHALILVW